LRHRLLGWLDRQASTEAVDPTKLRLDPSARVMRDEVDHPLISVQRPQMPCPIDRMEPGIHSGDA
jgi:hypothetical protein